MRKEAVPPPCILYPLPRTLSPVPRPPLQLVCRDSPIQRTARQAQRLGGAADVAIVSTQRFLNQQAFHLFECQILETWRRRGGAAQGEIVRPYVISLREQHRA